MQCILLKNCTCPTPTLLDSDSGDCVSLSMLGQVTSLPLSAVHELLLSALQTPQRAFLSFPSGTVSFVRLAISQVTTPFISSIVLIFRCAADSPAKATLCLFFWGFTSTEAGVQTTDVDVTGNTGMVQAGSTSLDAPLWCGGE